VTWLRLVPALIVLAGIAAAFWAMGRPAPVRGPWVGTVALAVGVAIAWVATTGVFGGPLHPAGDWYKHFAILSELVRHPWPVHLTDPSGQPVVVRYYIGFYLVPAFVAKAFGVGAISWLTGLWMIIGTSLTLTIVLRLFRPGPRRVAVAFAFVFFSGLDVVGSTILHLVPNADTSFVWTHMVLWAHPLEFTSNLSLLHWVPNQALAGWIGTLVLIEVIRLRKVAALPVAIFAMILWSPLATIGLSIFAVAGAAMLVHWRAPFSRRDVAVAWSVLGVATIVIVLYLTAGSAAIAKGLIFVTSNDPVLLQWLLLLVLWVGIYTALVVGAGVKPGWFGRVMLYSLIALPLFWFGFQDEFDRRATIPALFVLSLFVIRAMVDDVPRREFSDQRRRRQRISRIALIVAFCVGAVAPICEIGARSVESNGINQVRLNPRCGLFDQCSRIPDIDYNQYVAPANTPWIVRLIR
jgi:hypothetical protein